MRAQGDYVRTLAIAAWFAKYDPDQPRVPAGNTGGGRWTSGGAAGGVSSDGGEAGRVRKPVAEKPVLPQGAAVLGATAPASTAPRLGRPASPGELTSVAIGARAAVADFAAEGLGALAGPVAFGAVLIAAPSSAGAVADGTLNDHSEIHYHYDEDQLTVYRQDSAGSGTVLFSGWPGGDGVWRTADGVAIGRSLGPGRGLLLNQDALERVSERAVAAAAAADVRKRPQLCPDPGPDHPGRMSQWAADYQQKVTGLPPGLAVTLNGVVFDGCRTDGIRIVMLEAKGWGYGPRGIDRETQEWRPTFQGYAELVNQMTRQSIAAGSWTVEWHVAEQRVAELLSREAVAFPNIVVMYDPRGTGGRRVTWNAEAGEAEIEP